MIATLMEDMAAGADIERGSLLLGKVRATGGSRGRKGTWKRRRKGEKKYQGVLPICSFFDGATFFFFFVVMSVMLTLAGYR